MSDTITIDLLRHGRTQADDVFRGVTDIPLNDEGWQQMLAATGEDRWDSVVSSPLSRCAGFAHYVATSQDINLRIDENFKEYDFGQWDGQTYDAVMATQEAAVRQFFANPEENTPPGGESYPLFRERVITAWEQVIESSSVNDKRLIVCHGGVILVILAHILEVKDVHGKVKLPYASRTRIEVHAESGAYLVSHR